MKPYQIQAGGVLIFAIGIYAWAIYGTFFMSPKPDDWHWALSFFIAGSFMILFIGSLFIYDRFWSKRKLDDTTGTIGTTDVYDTIDIKRM